MSTPGAFSLKIAVMLMSAALLINSSPCEARVYRCTNASGNISYSQTPCPAGQTGAKMRGIGTTKVVDREACSLVRSFATESFNKLRGGTESSQLIDKYGGPSYIDTLTLNVINFVSGYRLSEDISAMKVSGLAYNKCVNGGFGKLQRDNMPTEMLPPRVPASQPPVPGQAPPQIAPENER